MHKVITLVHIGAPKTLIQYFARAGKKSKTEGSSESEITKSILSPMYSTTSILYQIK